MCIYAYRYNHSIYFMNMDIDVNQSNNLTKFTHVVKVEADI